MEIPKATIVEFLRSKGQDGVADQAEQRLPDNVDLAQHRDLLTKIGVNPDDLPGPLGGLFGKIGL